MAKYDYIDTTGSTKSIDASSSDEAIKNAVNRDPNSGVSLSIAQPAPTPGVPNVPTISNPNAPTFPIGSVVDTGSGPKVTTLNSPLNPPSSSTSGTPAPILPTPNAKNTNDAYFTSATQNVANDRKAVEDAYKTNIDSYQKKIDDANKNVTDLEKLQQEGVISNIDELSKPYRETLENTERERLYVNQNFEANQKLVNELEGLLNDGNTLINQTKALPIATSVLNRQVAKTMSDVAARAGVIQAVMAARNGQIGQAYNLIDRSVQAIDADRKDRLAYYKTLNDFYETKKDTEGKKVIQLTGDQKKFMDAQIGLLENDLATSQKNAEHIKTAMSDPDTALAYAQSGVTLNDTPEQISKKLGDYAYAKENQDFAKDMALKGYVAVVPGQAAPAGTQVISVADSKGNVKKYYTKATSSTTVTPEEKQISAFQKSAADYILKMSAGDIKWSAAFSALRAQYPQASTELIDQTLGIDNRKLYDK